MKLYSMVDPRVVQLAQLLKLHAKELNLAVSAQSPNMGVSCTDHQCSALVMSLLKEAILKIVKIYYQETLVCCKGLALRMELLISYFTSV